MTHPSEGDIWQDDNGDWLMVVRTDPPAADTSFDHNIRVEGDEHVCMKCHKRWDTNDPDVPPCD